MYSQNKEEEVILDYFKDQVGSLLDIGANDGLTLSNSRALIERGWRADLIEPSPKAFAKLESLYENNGNVSLYQVAIGEDKEVILYESSTHLNKGDIGLLSTTVRSQMERWQKEEFTPVKVKSISFKSFLDNGVVGEYDFISIDAEGMDLKILLQIDLTAVKCRCLCAEWNGDPLVSREIVYYCHKHGLKLYHSNHENLILCKSL